MDGDASAAWILDETFDVALEVAQDSSCGGTACSISAMETAGLCPLAGLVYVGVRRRCFRASAGVETFFS